MEPNALEISAGPMATITIYELILNADPIVKGVMALLVLASVICWAIIFEKTLRLSAFGRQARLFERFARSAGSSAPSPRQWLTNAIASSAARQNDASSNESRAEFEVRVEKAMRLTAREALNRLQPRLRFLATVGSTAPFVGLFGTVWGIMNSFTAIAAQKDTSLAVVAPGIAEALFATALGLVAAIPAVVAYNQVTGGMSRLNERLNLAIARLANDYSADRTKITAER
jgi:biopolymer transport protein ExbB/TolQ